MSNLLPVGKKITVELPPMKEGNYENNCYVGQGFLFSKPLPPSELEEFFQKKSLRIS